MSESILTALNRITGIPEMVQATQLANMRLQDPALFQLAFTKATRLKHLRSIFSGKKPKKIYLSNNIKLLATAVPGLQLDVLEKDYFQPTSIAAIQQKKNQLEGTIVIVNNNDIHQGGNIDAFGELFRHCENTIFIAWDWDNHHWLSLSYPLAALSDIYCPAHYENLYPLTRFNAALSITPCGVVQWPLEFLAAHESALSTVNRSSMPLGKHIFYNGFNYRNQVIATLSPRYPSVGFSTHQFHELTPEQKFAEWTQYKLHLIVPVLNDVPIRLFDAWVTGGIPLVPESLRFSPVLSDTDKRDIVFYSATDLIEPEVLIERANHLFDAEGETGLLRRHRHGLSQHHGVLRIKDMLATAKQLIGFVD